MQRQYSEGKSSSLKMAIVMAVLFVGFSSIGITHFIAGRTWKALTPLTFTAEDQYCPVPGGVVLGTIPSVPYREEEMTSESTEKATNRESKGEENALVFQQKMQDLKKTLSDCQKELEEARQALEAKTAINQYMRLEKRRPQLFGQELLKPVKEPKETTREALSPTLMDASIPCELSETQPCAVPSLQLPSQPSVSEAAYMEPVEPDTQPEHYAFCNAKESLVNISQSILQTVSQFANSSSVSKLILSRPDLKSFAKFPTWLKRRRSILSKPFAKAHQTVKNALMRLPKSEWLQSFPKMVKSVKTSWKKHVNKYIKNLKNNVFQRNFVHYRNTSVRRLRDKITSALTLFSSKWSAEEPTSQQPCEGRKDNANDAPVCEYSAKSLQKAQRLLITTSS
jgi:hypothetical protein